MKKFNISLQNFFPALIGKKQKAFTLAEILLSLTVIGIVAAIALPSLLGNANERAWETQKKALYTRFSQALPLLPSLNGYGELYEKEKTGGGKELVDTAAETFVRDGLSKVIKITNICDNDHLTDCGLPDKIIPLSGTSQLELSNMKSLIGFNPRMINATGTGTGNIYEQLDTKAAAFETVNGESILVYYNPNCQANLDISSNGFSQPLMCANFIYDLNGKKGPNTVGKDIGVITALYSTNSSVVSPNPYPSNLSEKYTFSDAAIKCREMDENAKVPNIDEASSLYYNARLFGISFWSSFMTSTTTGTNAVYQQGMEDGIRFIINRQTAERLVRCVKR